MRSGSLSFKDLTAKLPELTPLDCSNGLAILVKHNLVRAWVSEFDQITYYSFEEGECLLRVSAPRYLQRLRSKHSHSHQTVAETIYMYGSLLKREVLEVLGGEEGGFEAAIEDLIAEGFLVQAQSYFEGAAKQVQADKNKR